MRDTQSRSPSPAPSTGMESSLFKEAHMQIEIMSSQHPSSGIVKFSISIFYDWYMLLYFIDIMSDKKKSYYFSLFDKI